MKKITFLMLHLGYGGVESAIANQSNMLCNDFEVEIVSLYKMNYRVPYEINSKVKITYLSDLKPNKEEFIWALKKHQFLKTLKEGFKSLKILYLKKKLIKEYIKKCDADIIVSTRLSFNKSLGKYAKKDKIKIAQEHAHHNNNEKYINKLIKSVQKIDYLMPVSKELTNFYKKKVGNHTKCVYIKHALDFEIEDYKFKTTNNLIAVARLSKEKGFSDLLDVIDIVRVKNPKIKLNLIGDGVEKKNLEEKIKELKLEKNVIMHGFKTRKEIKEIIKDCSLYCMTSFEESFGLSVIESMAYGLPCIAFDDAKGVLEIINKDNGIAIRNRNKQKMAREIELLLKDKKRLKDMSKNSYNTSLNYSFNIIKEDWINFYKGVLK